MEEKKIKKNKKEEKLKYGFRTIEKIYPKDNHCYYSGLPSPSAYGSEKDGYEETNK